MLGISYRELAVGVCGNWNFPNVLWVACVICRKARIKQPQNQIERLRLFSNLAGDLLPVIEQSLGEADKQSAKVLARYGNVINWSAREFRDYLQEASGTISTLPVYFGRTTAWQHVLQEMVESVVAHTHDENGDVVEPGSFEQALQAVEVSAEESAPLDPAAILSSGVQDITNTLVSSYNLNDLLRMTLETMRC